MNEYLEAPNPRELKCCIGLVPEGGEMTATMTIEEPWIAFYCSECGNPLGMALPPGVIEEMRWTTIKTPWITLGSWKLPKREYPLFALCARCMKAVKVDWRELQKEA